MPKLSNVHLPLDIEAEVGATLVVPFQLVSVSVPVSSVGYQLSAEVLDDSGATVATFAVQNEDVPTGLFSVVLDSATMASLAHGTSLWSEASRYRWRLRMVKPTGEVVYPYGGAFRLSP